MRIITISLTTNRIFSFKRSNKKRILKEQKTIVVIYLNTSISMQRCINDVQAFKRHNKSYDFFIVRTEEETRLECINPTIMSPKDYKSLNDKLDVLKNSLKRDKIVYQKEYWFIQTPDSPDIETLPFDNTNGVEFTNTILEYFRNMFTKSSKIPKSRFDK